MSTPVAPQQTKSCARCRYPMSTHPNGVDCRSHGGRGLCNFCHRRSRRDGTLLDYERPTRTLDEVMTEWEILRSEGYTRRQAADRLGMKWKAFEKAHERARHSGDPRALPAISVRSEVA